MRDAFEALALAPTWTLEAQVIRDAQRRIASRCHPDRCPDAASRDAAQRAVARANAAASVLLDPVDRGQALLDLLAPTPAPPDPRPSPAFLVRMMELREAIDAGHDLAAVEAQLDAMHAEAQTEADGTFARLVAGDAGAWVGASEALGRLRALRRAREELLRR